MTTTKLTRRTALLGTVTLPAAMAPVGALAKSFQTGTVSAEPNATDAAWAELKAAKAALAERNALYDAFEDSLPVGPVPRWQDFEDKDEWHQSCDARFAERKQYPANPYDISDEELAAFCDPINAAEDALLATPAVTLTDVERKIVSLIESDRGDDLDRALVEPVLTDVRRMNGRAV